LRKGDLTETEIQKEMPAESFRTELKALNTKYNTLIWVISAGVVILSTVIAIVGLGG